VSSTDYNQEFSTMRFQFQAKVVAWVDIILSTVVLFFLLLGSFIVLTEPEVVTRAGVENDEQGRELSRFMSGDLFTKILFLAPSICYFVAEIVLGIFLLKAAEALNYKKLRTWYVITITMAIVLGIVSIPAVVTMYNGMSLLFFSWNLAFTVYSLWIVHLLRNEIKADSLPGQYNYSQAPPAYQASFTNSNYVFPPPASAVGGGTKEPMKI